jgi:hypothetical protein
MDLQTSHAVNTNVGLFITISISSKFCQKKNCIHQTFMGGTNPVNPLKYVSALRKKLKKSLNYTDWLPPETFQMQPNIMRAAEQKIYVPNHHCLHILSNLNVCKTFVCMLTI